ncbi:hypothetical protein TIFTF001_053287 [Ficus carica]|uniref:Uncharacterized protein n=1 Tax=Ficus carica TaxID=3494 RepID=A0AA88EMU3_FICCA|nr:hypothetical protein TIFTF001_053287 [Ficus carica]
MKPEQSLVTDAIKDRSASLNVETTTMRRLRSHGMAIAPIARHGDSSDV